MPSAPPEMQERWETDSKALDFLKSHGYSYNKDYSWNLPNPNHKMTDQEADAISYLILEWDWAPVAVKSELP